MDEEKVLLNATVSFLFREDKILLGFKTKKIGKNRWNGYGGGVETGESNIESAVRELEEETGGVITKLEDMQKIAIIDFHNTKSDGEEFICRVHVYLVKKWIGEVKVSDEMIKPTWFNIHKLPFDEMMPADRDWLPHALSGKKVVAKAYLGPFQRVKLKETEISYVDYFLST